MQLTRIKKHSHSASGDENGGCNKQQQIIFNLKQTVTR